MVSKLITFGLVVLCAVLIESQTLVPSCSYCSYGECETALINNAVTYQCHCTQGVKGACCNDILNHGENQCLSNPCWNGAQCTSNGYGFTCACPAGYSGIDCRTVGAVTNPVTFPPVRDLPDKKIIVVNKGGYTSWMELIYYNPTKTVQTGSITSGQAYAFYVPGELDYNVGEGARLNVYALGGNTVFSERVFNNPACYHVWGTTLNGQWSPIDIQKCGN